MSTIKVTNIQATGETATRSATGIAAAWVNFTGSSPFQIEDSLNTSSITDNSTGRYNIAQTNNFANANYGISHGCHYETGNGYYHSYHAKSTTTVEFLYISTLNAYTDSRDVTAALHGTLA